MEEKEFQALLDQRVEELQSAGEPAEKIQEWIDGQWAGYDAPEDEVDEVIEEDPIVEDPIAEEPSIEPWIKSGIEGPQNQVEPPLAEQPQQDQPAVDEVEEQSQNEIQAEVETRTESRLIQKWNNPNKGINKDNRKAYDKWKETGEFDVDLLGLETRLEIDADELREESRTKKDDETEEEYYARLRELDVEDSAALSIFGDNMVSRAFYEWSFREQQGAKNRENGIIANLIGIDTVLDKADSRMKELDENKSSMPPEEYDKEYKKALSIKNAGHYKMANSWDEQTRWEKAQASRGGSLDIVDEEGDLDYGKVWEGIKDLSLIEEVLKQAPNIVGSAVVDKTIGRIPIAGTFIKSAWYGNQMMNEYRTKVVNTELDKKYGIGKWGGKEYVEFARSDEGKALLEKADVYGFGAGQIDMMVDGALAKGGAAIPGLGLAAKALKKTIANKAYGMLAKKTATVVSGAAKWKFGIEIEKATEHLQEEIGSHIVDDKTLGPALQKVAQWYYAKDTYYSDEEIQQVGNLRALTGITAGVMSTPGAASGTVKKVRAINQDRIVDGKRMTQKDVQKMRPSEVIDANNADLEEANRIAEEYKGKEIPDVVKGVLEDLVGNVENRNNNHQVILGEHSEESMANLNKIGNKIEGFQKILEDENISQETKDLVEGKITTLQTEKDEAYYAPLMRDQKRNEYKEESRDEFTRLDEINRKLRNPDLTSEEKQTLHAEQKKYLDEIKGKQTSYQIVDENNPQNIIDNIRNVKDRRINVRKENENRSEYKKRITNEINATIGEGFAMKGLSGPQKTRLVNELLENNAGFVNKQVRNFKSKSYGTDFTSAFTSDDFKSALETQLVKNAESYDPSKGKFGTRALSGVKGKAWNIAKALENSMRDKSRETWGENFSQLETKDNEGNLYDVLHSTTADDDVNTGEVELSTEDEGSFDENQAFVRDDISAQSQLLLNHVHGLNKEQVADFDAVVLKQVKESVEVDGLSILKGEGQFISKLNKKVRGSMMDHLNKTWGDNFQDQLKYVEDNFESINGMLPAHSRNGKFFDGLFVDPDAVTIDEVLKYLQADTPKNNKVRMRKLRNALVERMTDVSLERVMINNPEVRLISDPAFQLNEESYIENRDIRDKTVEGFSDKLDAAWAGTGVEILDTQAQWDRIAKTLNLPAGTKVSGFQYKNKVAINPKIRMADTKLHELSHVFLKAMKALDPKRYKQGVELIKKSKYYKEILDNEGYNKTYGDPKTNSDKYAEEALATAIGREGVELYDNLKQQSKWDTYVEGFKSWFNGVFGIGYDPNMTMEDWVTNTSIDIIQGNNIVKQLKELKNEGVDLLNNEFFGSLQIVDDMKNELGYDKMNTNTKNKFMIESFVKANPELQNVKWQALEANYPNELKQMIKLGEELGAGNAKSMIQGNWSARVPGVALKRSTAELDKARADKLKGREAVESIIHAINSGDPAVNKIMTTVFEGLSPKKKESAKTELAAARIANLLKKNVSELPASVAEAFMKEVETLDPTKMTWKGKTINLTEKGSWGSSSAQARNVAEMTTELARWPKKVKDLYLENLDNVINEERRILGPAVEVVQRLKRFKDAILILRQEGKMSDIQAKQALKVVQENSIERQIELHKESYRDGGVGPMAEGFDTKKADYTVRNAFDTMIGALEITPAALETSDLSTIIDPKKTTGGSEVLFNTNLKSHEVGPHHYNAKSKLAATQKQKELERIDTALNKQTILKDMLTRIADGHKNGNISLETAWRMNWFMWQRQNSLGRSAAPRTYYDERAFKNDDKKIAPFIIEHMMPTDSAKTMSFAAALDGDKAALNAVFENFVISDLEKHNDEFLNLNHIDLQSKTLRGVFDENFKPMGNIPGTTVPYSIIRYMNNENTINLFKLKKYADKNVSVADELGIPKHFEKVFDAIDAGGPVEYKGIAYQIADNAVEAKVLENTRETENPYTGDISASTFNEAERANISFQVENLESADRGKKLKSIQDLLNDPQLYKTTGPNKKTKIDDSARNKLEAYKSLLEDPRSLSNDDLNSIWFDAREIIKTGKSSVIERNKALETQKEMMRSKGDEFITKTTGIKGEITANRAKAIQLEKKSYLNKLSGLYESFKGKRLLATRSNNDLFGLLYDLLPSGKGRKEAQAWQKDNIIDPLNDANYDYVEAKYAMQNNQQNALAKLGGVNIDGLSGRKVRSLAAKAKKKLEQPNKAGINIDGQVISDAQVLRIFNDLKNPSKHERIKQTLSDGQIKQIADYITLNNSELLGFSNDILNNYSAASADIHSKMNSRGYRGVGKVRITPEQRRDPIIQQVYGSEGVPTYAPYSPDMSTSEVEIDYGDMLGKGGPYAEMAGRLKQQSYGKGPYQVAAHDVFSDLQHFVGPSGPLRTAAFLDFAQNISGFMSKENLDKAKLSNKLGDAWVGSMKDNVRRIVTGTNRPAKIGKREKAFMNWINGSTAAIMFFNTRSGVLQFLSTTNYLVQNPGAVFGGIAATVKDPKSLGRAWQAVKKSAWYNERGKGASQLEYEEIFSQDNGKILGSEKMGKMLRTFQKYGYSITKGGDKGAIALGGVPFVAGRIAHYDKQGMTSKEAEIAAVKDFIAAAEEAQQSSRAERLGQEQTSSAGRILLTFANTPMQYNRLMSRALQDFGSAIKTGDAKTAAHSISKIAYFGVIQNALFNFLQGAVFLAMGKGDEEEDKLDNMANSMADTILRGSGIYGAIASTIKNLAIKRIKKGRWDKADVFKSLLNTSPQLGNKATALDKIVKKDIYMLSDSEYSTETSDIYRAAYATNLITNIPADRILKKYEALADLAAYDLDEFEKTLRVLGYDRYTLGEDYRDTDVTEDSRMLEDMRENLEELFER